MDPLYDVFYEKYCLLHSLYGAERRLLKRGEFETLDKELLVLIEKSQDEDLSMSEITRIKEIEYLLLDDVAEGFYT